MQLISQLKTPVMPGYIPLIRYRETSLNKWDERNRREYRVKLPSEFWFQILIPNSIFKTDMLHKSSCIRS